MRSDSRRGRPLPLSSSQLLRAMMAGFSFYVVAVASIFISRNTSDIALVWLANIAAAGFSFRQPVHAQIAILATCFMGGIIANVTTGAPWQSALIFMTANAAEIACLNLILRERLQHRQTEYAAADFAKVVAFAAFVAPIVSGTTAIGLLSLVGAPHSWRLWTSWWIADAAGIVTLLPVILLSSGAILSSIGFRRAVHHVAWIVVVLAATVLMISHIAYPFVYVGLAVMLVAMLSNPFWTATYGALVVVTISACAFEGIFGVFANGAGAVDNALHLHASVAVFPPIILSLVLHNLKVEKARVVEVADQFRRVMEDSAIGMALVSGKGKILKANKAMAEMFGYSISELETLTVADITGAEDQNLTRETFAKMADGSLGRFRLQKRYKRRDGTEFWAQLAGSVIRSAHDDSYYTISQIEDIDSAKRHQLALEEMEERWRFAFIAAKQGVWDANLATGRTYYSPAWCALLGYEPDEIGDDGNRWVDFLHPDDRESARQLNDDQIEGRSETFEAQLRMLHKDGRWVWILDRGQVIERNADGVALRMIGTHTDITAQKEVEQQMMLLGERINLAVQAGEVATWHWNPHTERAWWDERMFTLYDVRPEDFQGTFANWSDRVHPEDLPKVLAQMDAAVSSGSRIDTEFRVVTQDGGIRHIRGLASMTASSIDGSRILVGTNWDITDQKQLVDQLTEANDKLKEFASFASHDLQAPLRHIRMQGELIKIALEGRLTPEVSKPLEAITSKSKYLQDMIRNLLTFARAANDVKFQEVSLEKVVSDSIEEILPELRDCGGRIDCGALPDVNGDESLLRQVFQNLLMNAIKYRGKLPPVVTIEADLEPRQTVITIADNGIGIDPKYQDYIFEAFKRIPTRGVVQGSGLGLTLCRRIVESHGGEIWLESAGASGSVFKMRLPM